MTHCVPRRTRCLWNHTIKNTIEKQNRKLDERCTLFSHCLKPLRTQGCFCSCVVGGHSYEQPLHFIRNKADMKACVVRDQHLENTWLFLLGMWAHTCNNNTWNPETRASWFQGSHEVNSKFQDSLSYETLFQNKKKMFKQCFHFCEGHQTQSSGKIFGWRQRLGWFDGQQWLLGTLHSCCCPASDLRMPTVTWTVASVVSFWNMSRTPSPALTTCLSCVPLMIHCT